MESQVSVEWKDTELPLALRHVKKYLEPFQDFVTERSPSLDVIVPTYRCDLTILTRICTLPVANDATYFIIIVDDPSKACEVQEVLEGELGLPRVRVRGNQV